MAEQRLGTRRISEGKGNPVEISNNAIKYAKENKFDYVLTASDNGDISLGDRKNMCYMGGTVVYGRAVPVRSLFIVPFSRIWRNKSRYCFIIP